MYIIIFHFLYKNILTFTLENCTEDTDLKVKFICSFLEKNKYKDNPIYGNRTYTEDQDQFISFCRNLLLK